LLGLAAAVAAALVVAGFLAVLVAGHTQPSLASTPTPHPTLTTTPAPTATQEPTAASTPTAPLPSPFVCANPAGSQLVYAYVRGDRKVYEVVGCSKPKLLYPDSAIPIAWSPSHRYLAITHGNFDTPSAVIALDTQSGVQSPTGYTSDFGSGPKIGDTFHIFLGWIDDQTFLGAITHIVEASGGEDIGPSSLVRVKLGTGTETPVTRITWWANAGSAPRLVAGGHYLFYGGYQSKAEGQAYLHRIDLTTGTDTRLVPLGMYGNGGCQATPICGWTGPWAVSADGRHILYHKPGPSSSPSDTNTPKDTPILYANPDGSAASKPFGGQLAVGLTTPVFSPDGAYAVAASSSYTGTDPFSAPPQVKLVPLGGAPILINGSLLIGFGDGQGWRGDSKALLLEDTAGHSLLYTLATGNTTPLEANTHFYVWANS
jgi:hypothetical protein